MPQNTAHVPAKPAPGLDPGVVTGSPIRTCAKRDGSRHKSNKLKSFTDCGDIEAVGRAAIGVRLGRPICYDWGEPGEWGS
jgi:hypothetical protein